MRSVLGVLILLSLGLGACTKSPFYNEYPRTPYERYQMLRGTDAPRYEYDTYGNRQPALRPRLTPPDRR
ncbi:MAG: hypothetical protein AAGH88_04080 [Planctomycetota bacterium]